MSVSAWAKESPVFDPETIEGVRQALTIEHVIDGDTFKASGRTIRLWGIDAPEKNEPFYWISTEFLKSILDRGQLECKFIEKDRYKRDVIHCKSDGLDVGSMMVQMGMARDYSKYSGNYYQYEENLAKQNKYGMWK